MSLPPFPLVPIKRLVATPGALQAVSDCQPFLADIVARHARGDWGEVDENDRRANDQALQTGERLLSAYTTPTGIRLWVITEADRSSTCVLLPEEY